MHPDAILGVIETPKADSSSHFPGLGFMLLRHLHRSTEMFFRKTWVRPV
jgi:hypothetical protein